MRLLVRASLIAAVVGALPLGSRAASAQAATPGAAPAAAAPSAPPAGTSAEGSLGELDLAAALRQGDGPMTADQAAARAVKTAPSVARARAASARARSGADQALVAVYPRLQLEASYTRLSEHDSTPVASVTGMGMAAGSTFLVETLPGIPDVFTLRAEVAYPVSDVFLQILPRHEAASRAVEAQELSAKADAQSIALTAREAFYNYARARAALEVARSGLAQTEAQRRDVDALVGAGTLARVESMRAAAVVAAAKVQVARAQGGVAVARTALRSLVHAQGEQEIGIGEDLSAAPPELREGKDALLAQALQKRSELAAVRTMIDVHETTRDANGADGYPKLSVVGSYDLSNPNQRAAPFEKEFNGSWSVSGVLSWSPNDLAASSARKDQAGADREVSLSELAALEDALRQEVGAAYEDHLAAVQAMEAAQTGIVAAEESHRVRREQFKAGAAVATDVIDAENELRKARLELVNAAIDARIAKARVDRAVER